VCWEENLYVISLSIKKGVIFISAVPGILPQHPGYIRLVQVNNSTQIGKDFKMMFELSNFL
jgi:hypothetical protein